MASKNKEFYNKYGDYWVGSDIIKEIDYDEKSIQMQEKNDNNEKILLYPTTLSKNIGLNYLNFVVDYYLKVLDGEYTQDEIKEELGIDDEEKLFCPLLLLINQTKSLIG